MAASRYQTAPAQWETLGGLRFLLAMVVVSVHVEWMAGRNPVVVALGQMGALPAVLCFLVVSGYSIAHSIVQRREGFYDRRFRRIYPLYALAVLADLVPNAIRGGFNSNTSHMVLANLLFLQTFRTRTVPCNGVLWTLAVEVACYAAAPLLVRLRTAWLLTLTAASAVAYAIYPRLGLDYYTGLRHGLPLLFLGWAWLAGFVYYRLRDRWSAGVVLIAGSLGLTYLNSTYLQHFSRVTMVGGTAVIVFCPYVRLPRACRRVLAFAGDLSYPLYLFHTPLLLTYAWRFHGQNQWFVIGASLLLATIMWALDAAARRPVAWATRRVMALAASGATIARRASDGLAGAARLTPAGRLAGWVHRVWHALVDYACVPSAAADGRVSAPAADGG
jgi:peptidoglycan/LPS O-acetylase OafA/YrhL